MYKELSASYKMQAYTFTPESDDLFSLLFFALLKCLWKNSLCIWHRQHTQCFEFIKKVTSKILASEASYWSSVHYMLLHSFLQCTLLHSTLFILCTLFHSALTALFLLCTLLHSVLFGTLHSLALCSLHSLTLCTLLYNTLLCTLHSFAQFGSSLEVSLEKEGNLIFLVKILAFY